MEVARASAAVLPTQKLAHRTGRGKYRKDGVDVEQSKHTSTATTATASHDEPGPSRTRAKGSFSKALQLSTEEMPFVVRLPVPGMGGERDVTAKPKTPSSAQGSTQTKQKGSASTGSSLSSSILATSPSDWPPTEARVPTSDCTPSQSTPTPHHQPALVRTAHPLPPKPPWIGAQAGLSPAGITLSSTLPPPPPSGCPSSMMPISHDDPTMYSSPYRAEGQSATPISTSASPSPSPPSSSDDSMLSESGSSFWGVDGSASTCLSDWTSASGDGSSLEEECRTDGGNVLGLEGFSPEGIDWIPPVPGPSSSSHVPLEVGLPSTSTLLSNQIYNTFPAHGPTPPPFITQLADTPTSQVAGAHGPTPPLISQIMDTYFAQEAQGPDSTRDKVCFDWLMGKCYRCRCKYPHYLPAPRPSPSDQERSSANQEPAFPCRQPMAESSCPPRNLPPRLSALANNVGPGVGVPPKRSMCVDPKRSTCVDWEAGWCSNDGGRCPMGVHRREGEESDGGDAVGQSNGGDAVDQSNSGVPSKDGRTPNEPRNFGQGGSKSVEICRNWEMGRCRYDARTCHRWHGTVPPNGSVPPRCPVPPVKGAATRDTVSAPVLFNAPVFVAPPSNPAFQAPPAALPSRAPPALPPRAPPAALPPRAPLAALPPRAPPAPLPPRVPPALVPSPALFTTTPIPLPSRQEKLAQTCSRWVRGDCTLSDLQCQRYHTFDIPAEDPLAYTLHEHNHILVTAGFAVDRVTTAFDTTWIFVDGIPDEPGSIDEMGRLLEGFGKMTRKIVRKRWPTSPPTLPAPLQRHEKSQSTSHPPSKGSKRRNRSSTAPPPPPCPPPQEYLYLKASYDDPGEALRAATHIHSTAFRSSTLTAQLSRTSTSSLKSRNTSLRLEWNAPKKVGYAGYQTMAEAEEAVARAHGSQLGDCILSAHIHRDLPSVSTHTVKFVHAPADATQEDLCKFGEPDDVVWEAPTYSSSQLQAGLDFVHSELNSLADLHSVDVLPPPYRHGRVHLWAHFSSVAGAKAAATSLHLKRLPELGKTRLEAVRVTEVHFILKEQEHARISDDLKQLRKNIWSRGGRVTVRESVGKPAPGLTTIRLVADDAASLAAAKLEIDVAIKGEVVTEVDPEGDAAGSKGRVLWDSFFAHPAGGEYLVNLRAAHPHVRIEVDDVRRKLRLWGREDRRELVTEALKWRVKELRRRKFHFIAIPGRLLSLFMRREMLPLQWDIGPENVSVRVWERILRIRGDDTNYHKGLEALQRCQEAYPAFRHLISTSTSSRKKDCPVCFGETTDPITLRCGHVYCKPCLASYLESAKDHRTFPVHCVGSEAKCTAPVSIYVAQRVLTSAQFESLVQTSFLSFIQARPAEFRYCPTPDCQQIYRHPTPPGTILQCPSCLVRICPHCDTEYHDGIDCSDSPSVDAQSKESEKQFREWQAGRGGDVKPCPGCRVVIERSEGCNHVRCTKCGVHMCWLCLAVRESGGEVYDHMREAHGTIGGGLDWW